MVFASHSKMAMMRKIERPDLSRPGYQLREKRARE